MKIGFKKFQKLPNKVEIETQILTEARKFQAEGWSTHATIGRVTQSTGIGNRIVESVMRGDKDLMAKFKAMRKTKLEEVRQFWNGVDRGFN